MLLLNYTFVLVIRALVVGAVLPVVAVTGALDVVTGISLVNGKFIARLAEKKTSTKVAVKSIAHLVDRAYNSL